METRIILATLCFALSLASLARGIYLYQMEQSQSSSTSIFNATAAVNTLKVLFFNGINSRNGLVLMWKATPQTARKGFIVERKEADGSYTTVAEINTISRDNLYRFTDTDYSNAVEYRLRQEDAFTGTYYSKPVFTKHC